MGPAPASPVWPLRSGLGRGGTEDHEEMAKIKRTGKGSETSDVPAAAPPSPSSLRLTWTQGQRDTDSVSYDTGDTVDSGRSFQTWLP